MPRTAGLTARLLGVCRQVNAEAGDVPYGENTFGFFIWGRAWNNATRDFENRRIRKYSFMDEEDYICGDDHVGEEEHIGEEEDVGKEEDSGEDKYMGQDDYTVAV